MSTTCMESISIRVRYLESEWKDHPTVEEKLEQGAPIITS